MDVLQIQFLNANTVRRSRHAFTIYEIEVRSSHSIPWVLYKRYTDFFNLHQQLLKTIASDPKLAQTKITLPQLPPKSYKAIYVEYVEWRQRRLQEYLQELVQIPELVSLKQVCEFLTVPEEVRAMLQRRKNPGTENMGRSEPVSNNTVNKGLRPEEQEIMDLLKNLSLEQHKVKALAKFERFFFDKKPRYNAEYIQIFFVGDDVYQGVIQACGTFSHSKVARCAALNLLAKVLDIERNKEAPAFLDRFTKLDPREFTNINLHRHILEPQTQLSAFQLARIICEKLPQIKIESFIPEPWAEQEFYRWLDLQNAQVGKIVVDKPETDTPAVLSIEEGVPYIDIVNSKFRDIEGEFEDINEDWRWLDDKESGVNIRYKKNAESDIWKLKASLKVPVPADQVYEYILERGISFLSLKVLEHSIVDKLDDSTRVLRTVFKKYGSPYKQADCCTIISGQILDKDNYRAVTLSVNHPGAPESKDMNRVNLFASGWKLVGHGQDCEMVFYAQMTNDSILVVSPDLLGETNELQRSLLGIKEDLQRCFDMKH